MARTTRARRRLTLLGILAGSTIVAGVGSYLGITWVRARSVAAARVEGYAKFEAREYEAALDQLSKYVSKHRDDVDALLKLAACRVLVPAPNLRHLVDAAGFYREVLKLRPGNIEALSGLIDIYLTLGYASELEKVADEMLRYDPRNVAAIEARMHIARFRGDWKSAIDGVEQLVRLEPSVYRWRVMNLYLLAQSEPNPEARFAKIRSWIAEGEPDGRYQLLLAQTYTEAGKADEAVAAAKAAVDRGMPDAALLGWLVDELDLLQLPDEVTRAIDKALAAGLPPAEVVQMQVRRHFLAGRLDEAKRQLAAASGASGKDKDSSAGLLRWRIRIAELERDAAASDVAINELRAFAREHPALAEAEVTWADAIQASRGNDGGTTTVSPRIAMGQIQLAITAGEPDSFLMLRAGDVALNAGEVDEAVRYFSRAFEMEASRWALAGVRETSALLAVGRTEQAFRLARDLTRRFPDNVPTYFVFAQACDAITREGREPSSIDRSLSSQITASVLLEDLYSKVSHDNPLFLPPLLSTLVVDGDVEAASRHARGAIENPKTPAATLLQIASILSDAKFEELPSRAIEVAATRAGDPMEIVLAKAKLQIARGDAALARLALRSALDPNAGVGKAEGPIRAEFARVQAEAAIREGATDVSATLAEVLKEGGSSVDCVSFVLSQQATWEDEGVLNAAIARLGELIGETAPRTVMTNAARVLRSSRSTPEDIAKSIQAVNKVLEGNPESTVALVTLSRLFAASRPPELNQASEFLKRAVTLQPGRRDLYPELIALLQASGNFPDANTYLQQYMRSSATDDTHARLAAGLLVQQGQYVAAIPALERVAKKSGTEADLVALGDAERRMGHMEQAEAHFRKALELNSRTALSAMAYAEFLARSGRLDDARAMVEEDAKREKPALTPANRAYLRARLELDYGDPAKAGPAIAEAMQLAPKSPGVALLAAREKLAGGDSKAAIELANAGLQSAPNDQQLLAFVSSLMMADPSTRANSTAALEQLTKQNPALGELLQIVKACAGPDGTVAPGAAQLAALVELTNRYPSEPSVWSVAIELHVAVGRLEDAVRLAQRGMARLPADPAPAEFAARLLLQLRRPDEARDAARAWRTLTADSPIEADLVLARIALIAGKPKDAIETLQPYASRLKAEVNKRPDSLGLYAAALLFDGRVDKAFEAVHDGLEQETKENRPERALLAEWLRAIRTASTVQSLDALSRSEAILAADDTGRGALATEYIALARRKDAGKAADRAAAHLAALSDEAKRSPVSQLLLGDLAAIRGDAAGASAIYQAAWDGLPADARDKLLRWSAIDDATRQSLMGPRSIALFAANNQASALAKANLSLDTASSAIERALAMAPGDTSLLETKAEVLLARKEYDQARQILAPIVAMPDSTPSPRLVLARVEIASGHPDDALRQLQAAERLLADDPFADRTLIEALADAKRALEAAAAKPTA